MGEKAMVRRNASSGCADTQAHKAQGSLGASSLTGGPMCGSLWEGGEIRVRGGSRGHFCPPHSYCLGFHTVRLCIARAVTEVRGQKAQLCGLQLAA